MLQSPPASLNETAIITTTTKSAIHSVINQTRMITFTITNHVFDMIFDDPSPPMTVDSRSYYALTPFLTCPPATRGASYPDTVVSPVTEAG